MKKIYIAAIALIGSIGLQAQSFSLAPSDLTITVYGNSSAYASSIFTNTAGATVMYQYDLIVNSLNASWDMQFCDAASCYTSPRMTGQFELPRDGSAMFKLEVDANNVIASATYALRMYPVGDPTDDDTLTWTVNALVGTPEPAFGKTLSLYPNPSNGELFLSTSQGSLVKGNVEIFDLSGKLQSSTEVKAVAMAQLDVEALTPGMYLLRYTTAQGTVNRKFMKGE